MGFRKFLAAGAIASAMALAATGVQAAATISDGAFTVGVGTNGELFDASSYIGFQRASDGYDPLAPGTPRDSWGVTTSAGSAFADQSYYGVSNVTGTSFAGGGSSIIATSGTSVGVKVQQAYSFVGGGNILKVVEAITNTTGSTLTGVQFARNVDWDVSPTEFNENTFGPVGASPLVTDSSYYGFENPTAGVPYGSSCFSGCNATGDLGGGIQVGLADLAAGATDYVVYYYGLNNGGFADTGAFVTENVNGLISDAQGAGAKYIIATQSSENGAYPFLGANSALIGVAGVPEPATWALMLSGVGLVGASLRGNRRKAAAVRA